jgi:WD40 repeat protein
MARIALSFDAWKAGRVAPATVEMPVKVLDVKDSAAIRANLKGHDNPVFQVAFSPDGRTLASATNAGQIKLWDTAEGKERLELPKKPGMVLGMAFSPDGRTLFASYYQADAKAVRGEIVLWDVATGKERGVLRRDPQRGVTRMALSADGKTLVAGESWALPNAKERKFGLALWDVESGKVRTEIEGVTGGLALSPDGKTIAVARDGIHLYDAATGKEKAVVGAKETYYFAVAFSPDGRTLAACDNQNGGILLDVGTAKLLTTIKPGEGKRTSCVAFAPDGHTAAFGTAARNSYRVEPGEIVLCDTTAGRERLRLRGHLGDVLALAFAPDGRRLASGGGDSVVKVWEVGPRTSQP